MSAGHNVDRINTVTVYILHVYIYIYMFTCIQKGTQILFQAQTIVAGHYVMVL